MYRNIIIPGKGEYYTIFTTIKTSSGFLTAGYSIKKGVVLFKYPDYSNSAIISNGFSNVLSAAMLGAAQSINENYLSGRTIGGIDIELYEHWLMYNNGIASSHTQTANIGGMYKNKPGYDSNAWIFENQCQSIYNGY